MNRRVWDMVLHLIHPTALYVLFQLLIVDHLGKSRAVPLHDPLSAPALAVYAFQFLGAWTVLYTTLLRDMGLRSAWGTVLLVAALAGAILQHFLIPVPRAADAWTVRAWLGAQVLLAAVAWPVTFCRWRRLKRALAPPAHDSEGPSSSRQARAAGIATFATTWQQFEPGAEKLDQANDWFYTWGIWLFVLLPLVGTIVLAAVKRKRTPELPHLTDLTWTFEVDESELPVVVHAYQSWSIGDRVVENQVVKLAEANAGRLRAYWLEIDKCPGVVARYPTLEEKSVALFLHGRLAWQATGVHDHLTMQREIERFLLPRAAGETSERARS